MKAGVEVYKGIEFVRMSSLNQEQAASILASPFSSKMIKILRDNEIISDCLPYSSYLEWYHLSLAPERALQPVEFSHDVKRFKLALK